MTSFCPICNKGSLHHKIVKNFVEYRGKTTELNTYLSICDACGSEQADHDQTFANKMLMIDFKNSVDHSLNSDIVS